MTAYGDPEYPRLLELCRLVLRPATWDDVAASLVFDPPLSPEEQATLAVLERMARAKVSGISLAEWRALQPVLDEARTFRTRTPAEWQAMTAAQRDNALIQWCQDITDVLRAMLRN